MTHREVIIMKRIMILLSAVLLALFPCILSAIAVFYYTMPMEDSSYDLSLLPQDGQEWEGSKGWTVFTSENGETTVLTPNGIGGYSGLSYAGQTFYFSRKLTEKLDSPTLRIGTANRSISVFLDDTLLYTDCPESSEKQIGELSLPMQEYDRAEPITISLPHNYMNRTLTIAQSSPAVSETLTDNETVYPCEITLYCGYSYESDLIASAASIMIPSVLLFALEIILLAAFIWKASLGRFSASLVVLAVAVMLQIFSVLTKADFFPQYFGEFPVDLQTMTFHLSIGILLIFLSIYAGRVRPLFLILALVQCLSTGFAAIIQTGAVLSYGRWYRFFIELPQITGFLALFLSILCAFILWHRENKFFSYFTQTAILITLGYASFLLISIPLIPGYTSSVLSRIAGDFFFLLPVFSLKLIWVLCLLSSLAAVIIGLLEEESQRKIEASVLSAKNRLTLESYENLRLQSEEIMMLRHDTSRHYTMLRSMAEKSPEKLYAYLDKLVDQIQNVRPVVTSGNEMLDIIINGKLAIAAEKGIHTEISRASAPKKLPLHDTELCCLIMNILDNAIQAASRPTISNPCIRLDFHCKDQHFIFSCENSTAADSSGHKKKPAPNHGYGLKIIHQIMKQWGDMVSVQEEEGTYKISIVIPLS